MAATHFSGFTTTTVTIDPASIPAHATAAVNLTITGAAVGDMFVFEPPSALEAGLFVAGVVVTAADSVRLILGNATIGAIDGASRVWRYHHWKR